MTSRIKSKPLRSCEACKLNGSRYCRECYDFGLFTGFQTELRDFREETVDA